MKTFWDSILAWFGWNVAAPLLFVVAILILALAYINLTYYAQRIGAWFKGRRSS